MRRALTAAALLCASIAAFAAPPLPAAIVTEIPALALLGEGRLRWFGIHVYDSSLWVPGGSWSIERPFALDIRYAMNIKGRDLTQKSLEEMQRLFLDANGEPWRVSDEPDDAKRVDQPNSVPKTRAP